MKFKSGDLVIKTTGGNKMRVFECIDNKVDCIWESNGIKEDKFDESDLVYLDEYKSILVSDKRNDIIKKIINE